MRDDAPSLVLIPLGGLGNRLRFVNSAVHAAGARPVTILNFRTDMFAGSVADFLQLPAHVRVIDRRFRSEKLLIQLCKLLTPLSALTGGRVARYGARSLPPRCRVIASYITLDGMDLAHLPLRPVPAGPARPYNAIHVRGTDHAEVIAANPMDRFDDFVATSKRPVYLATDSEATKTRFRDRFGARILTQPIGLTRDSPEDLEAAFHELWTLIRARRFCPSRGSSFSTIATAYRKKAEQARKAQNAGVRPG